MMKLTFHKTRDTKNFALYECEASPFSKLYLPKGLPGSIVIEVNEAPKAMASNG